jgi:pimeloyl-ACP methyl ester carboxylesterase
MAETHSRADNHSRPRYRQFVAADGVILAADTFGEPGSPAVILMHGGGQTRHSWSGFVGRLVDAGYFVVNYDARGHGDSGWSADGVYNYPLRAADLRAIVRELPMPCALVGASMGGITALQAISEGYEPAALVLVDIVPNAERHGIQRIRDFMLGHREGFANAEEAAAAVAAYNPNRPKPATASGLLRNLRAGANGRWFWHWDPRILESDPIKAAADRRAIFDPMRFNPAVPTLLIRGLRSEVVSDDGVANFRRLLPTLQVADVAKAGHMVAGDDNDMFNEAALNYLRRNFAPTPLRQGG